MKKLLCVLLVFSFLFSVSFADIPDVSNLSKEELLELNAVINNLLFEKSLPDGVLVPSGSYIVGVDIPAGDYRADTVSDVGGVVRVYESKEVSETSPLSYISERYLGKMWGTLVFRLTLEEGNFLYINSNSLKLYPYMGLLDMSVPKD